MKQNYLTYALVDTYIHDWLVLGPSTTPVADHSQPGESAAEFCGRILAGADHVTCDFPQAPQEIEKIVRWGQDLYWEADHCQADHLLERTVTAAVIGHHYLWAFTRFSCPGAKSATLNLTTTSPISVWLNGRHVRYCDAPADKAVNFSVSLKPGNNDLLIRLESVAAGDVTLAAAIAITGAGDSAVKVRVPTVTQEPERRKEWENAFRYAYVDRAVYARDDTVQIICRDDMPGWHKGAVRLQKADGSIYAEIYSDFKAKLKIEGLLGMQLTAGPMRAVMMPPPEFYYDRYFRARRMAPFAVSMWHYTTEVVGTYEDRLIQAMKEADRSSDELAAEIAKMSLGWWDVLAVEDMRKVMARIGRYEADCLGDLLGLVAIRQRMGHYEKFPADLLPEIDACLLGFDYALATASAIDPDKEYNHIMLYTSQILAGQIYADQTFTASGLSGSDERVRAEKLAESWLHRHAQTGFAQWNVRVDLTVAGLALLADLAETDTIAEMAAVLLDKTLFGLAVNSFQGAYAAPRASARALWVRSGRFAPETPLNYLLWGVGGFNTYYKGVVGLSLAGNNYQMPDLLRTIALDQWPEMISRERHQIAEGDEANTVVCKTPDYMLASVQDYHAGQRGASEHVWQATLGPDAIVFANHPATFSDAEGRAPGWWCGNAQLPRVAQWKDALIALYNLPADDWIGFTHAFFPGYTFDEYMIEKGWAFARKGNGYLALHATAGMELMGMGDDAMRELRCTSLQTAWLCQMGRAEVDGSFETFRAAVLAKSVKADGLNVEWDTVRGDKLAFAWSGPLKVNGVEEAITGFKHVENPYAVAEFPAQTMDIGYGQELMRLHFV
jgi:hypothetical protein